MSEFQDREHAAARRARAGAPHDCQISERTEIRPRSAEGSVLAAQGLGLLALAGRVAMRLDISGRHLRPDGSNPQFAEQRLALPSGPQQQRGTAHVGLTKERGRSAPKASLHEARALPARGGDRAGSRSAISAAADRSSVRPTSSKASGTDAGGAWPAVRGSAGSDVRRRASPGPCGTGRPHRTAADESFAPGATPSNPCPSRMAARRDRRRHGRVIVFRTTPRATRVMVLSGGATGTSD